MSNELNEDSDTSSDVLVEQLCTPRKPVFQTPISATILPTNPDKKKQLPDVLSNFDVTDFSKFIIISVIDERTGSKLYGKEVEVVTSLIVDGKGESFEFSKLTTVQMRFFCKNVGVTYCGNPSKFDCSMCLANHINHNDRHNNRLSPTWYATRLTNRICRIINIIFHETFIEDFKTVNDIKNRKDHETFNTY
jgi:hypothetical protein